MTYQYRAKKWFIITHTALLCIGFLLALGRWLSAFHHDFVIINAEVTSHISNLSLSLIVYEGIGYAWLLFGKKFRLILMLGILLIAGNFVCETVMGFMNATDIMDAVYGTVGVLTAFVHLFFLYKYGLVEKESSKE